MGGLTNLGISLPTLLAQIVNFVILLGLLYLVAYRPLMRMLDGRSGKIKESMLQTEYIQEQAARAEEEAEKRIDAAISKGQELLAQASRTGEELKQQARKEASQAAEAIITKARSEIQRERDGVIDELRRGFADLTIMAAGKVIDHSLDKKAHHQLINKMLSESILQKN